MIFDIQLFPTPFNGMSPEHQHPMYGAAQPGDAHFITGKGVGMDPFFFHNTPPKMIMSRKWEPFQKGKGESTISTNELM